MEHWLITYAQRRHGHDRWDTCNDVHQGDVGEWLLKTKREFDETNETVLLAATPIGHRSAEALRDVL